MSRRSEATRRRLIAAARELIASDGLDISLSAVAERAGVTRMTLYRHFGPRRELLLEVLLEDVIPVAQAVGTMLADRSLSLAERAYRAMCLATLSLSATPLLEGVLAGGPGSEVEEIDPSGALAGLLTTAIGPFLDEAVEEGQLRGTPEAATNWMVRQILASVFGRRNGADASLVAAEIATYFLPSLLRVDDHECQRLTSVSVSGLMLGLVRMSPSPEPTA